MPRNSQISSTRAVGTSILVSLSDVLLNLAVALITGSVVMFAQALQGLADLSSVALLLVGVKQSSKPATPVHPFGYGREVFFWTMLASIFTFLVTGGWAIIRGISQIINPGSIEFVGLAIGMLIFGLVTNFYSLSVSARRLLGSTKGNKVLQHLFHSSLVETKMTLLVDLMGTIAALVGLIALGLFQFSGNIIFDGIGAATVGTFTAIGAGLLVYNLRGFIIGQSPSLEVLERIKHLTTSVNGVNDVLDLRAAAIGSGKFLVILEVHFQDGLTTDDIEKTTDKIKDLLISSMDVISQVQVEAETPDHELKK